MPGRVSGSGRHRFLGRPGHRGRRRLIVLVVGLIAGYSPASAVDGPEWKAAVWDAEAIYRGATIAPDLVLPEIVETVDRLTSPRMALIKPPGSGPFPAIVLMHQCSGLNVAVAASARAAASRGYVVLLVDSLEPRGVKSVCFGPKNGVNFFRGARDALQAAEQLRRMPDVDAQRIALVGFSWGAMVGLLAASPHYVDALKSGPGFAAVASFYPGCFRITPQQRPPYDLVNPDVSRPLLVLMGDADTETPAQECLDRLDVLKQAGAPVEWHLYAGATHCWDCQQLDGLNKIDVRGDHVAYHFRQDVTDDSRRRLFEFLDRVMPRRP
ncbi:dienelactone hydrolase family protein [Bradyrhizobium sp. WYCCWR 13023]|uniref:Dienelactone hydrolase family protein n=1 Tax=Bradyrhizobium zhengyangense TaxID=2911009 RepID=A0A9X1RKI8_9BRAD|nr:dienelactone hydrolase family protein [Bradyrhizobium zhengyangense]MCG2633108.1 dienelactone hydrolase family protein [Bradyrhizobium zhengyangense]MCG2638575.1 dienelactone hydrolase family protein [Bradyrhizobium zhengyangense]